MARASRVYFRTRSGSRHGVRARDVVYDVFARRPNRVGSDGARGAGKRPGGLAAIRAPRVSASPGASRRYALDAGAMVPPVGFWLLSMAVVYLTSRRAESLGERSAPISK